MQLHDVETFYPLSPLQSGLLFHSLSEPTSRMYFNQTRAVLTGAFDPDAFRASWDAVCARHPILRTFFVWEGVEEPVQVVKKAAVMPLVIEDWRELSASEREVRAEAYRKQDLARGFDLAQAPLMRAAIWRTGEDRHELFWSFHHLLMDGWSMFHVLQELFEEYDQRAAGAVPTAVASPRPYRDYIAWLRGQSLPEAERFWKERLGGFRAPTPLPEDVWRSPGDAADADPEDFATRRLMVPADISSRVAAFASEQRLTLNTILQAAWALTLSRSVGEDDVVFGAIVSGRPADIPGVEAMVGLFINALPVRVTTRAEEGVGDFLQRLQREQADLRDFEYSPLAEVQAWSELPGGTPLFETIFLFQNYHKDRPLEELSRSLALSDFQWFERHNYPIAALATPGDELELRIIYQTQRLSEAAVLVLLERWRNVLTALVADRAAPVAELDIMTPAERERVLALGTDTETDFPGEATIHGLFSRVASERPEAIALSCGEARLSYAELEARSNQLAHELRALGVTDGTMVGVSLERSPELVVAILGILKSGAAYVALDADYPPERLALMLTETAAPVVVTDSTVAARLPAAALGEAQLLRVDTDAQQIAARSTQPVQDASTAESLAYVIYTSGSTGVPKGTLIPHRAVVRLVRGTDFLEITPDDVFLLFAAISFDASTLELWGPLLNGARLAVFPAGKPSYEELGRVLRDEGVTILWLTAGLFHRMVEEHIEGLAPVRQLLAGGDVLSVQHVERALRELSCTVINGYGPTENTTFTCCHCIREPGQLGKTVPIGRPIANTTVYIVDERLQPVPVGVAGELVTGGAGVAKGYLQRPELDAERFVADTFSGVPGTRLYRTGDLARWRGDGTLDFLGRNDFQVKIRGFRIELGEIEHALGTHNGVADCVVMAREETSGDKRLVGYVVPAQGASPTTSELRAHLEERLPDYMIPQAFVLLEAFPLNANGKVDRAALPEPEGTRPELATSYAAPEAEVEKTIATIWQAALGLERVGIHDNFFDLGGHSLHLIRVHGQLKQALERDFPIVDLFQFPTIAGLAKHLGGDPGEPDPEGQEEDRSAAREKARAGKDRLRELRGRRRRN